MQFPILTTKPIINFHTYLRLKTLAGRLPSTPTGLYYINSTYTDSFTSSSYVSTLPLLAVQVVDDLCENLVITPSSTVSAPASYSISNPVLIDFSACFPAEEVTVIASISTGSDGLQYYDLVNSQQTIYNNGGKTSQSDYQIAFVLENIIDISDFTQTFTLSFQITGKNGKNYAPLPSLTVQPLEVDPSAAVPTVNSISASSITENSFSLTVKCSQQGAVNYAIYYASTDFSNTVNYHQTVTNYGQIAQTQTGPFSDAQKFAIFGYQLTQNQNFEITAKIENLRANSDYRAEVYCLSALGRPSVVAASTADINTSDNNSVPFRLKIFLADSGEIFTGFEKQILACAVYLALPCSRFRVRTDEMAYCTSSVLEKYETEMSTSRLRRLENLEQEEEEEDEKMLLNYDKKPRFKQINSGSNFTTKKQEEKNDKLENNYPRILANNEDFSNSAKSQRSYTYIYILKDQYSSSDSLMDTLSDLTQDSSDFYTNLSQLLPSDFPLLQNSIQVTELEEETTSDTIPNVSVANLEANGQSVSFTVTLNKSGFFLFGLQQVDDANREKITYKTLYSQTLASEAFKLYYVEYLESSSLTRTIEIQDLTINQIYTMYFLAVNENPSIYAITSSLYQQNIIAVNYINYNYNKGWSLQPQNIQSILILILFILLSM
ncbi:hypothetical protein PPERSA_07836 [Pseudocohnilembus persalinus]|uniref:Uncharacterized protein n=1 Tax=Pseudocohnilembus persalinus TaxID=266149 RepID=A0A0V0QCA2_PSEPJ|nr:hypothetical protein PPERSA_07836 [Pseudocohnilembus persalinus]|eukprot:KRW99759.1 hypothetical protein PPERSA_07836 [Pseudocohnilembus persalinus]